MNVFFFLLESMFPLGDWPMRAFPRCALRCCAARVLAARRQPEGAVRCLGAAFARFEARLLCERGGGELQVAPFGRGTDGARQAGYCSFTCLSLQIIKAAPARNEGVGEGAPRPSTRAAAV